MLRVGKALRCIGWYAVAVALAGFAVSGFADPQELLLFSLTMYAVYSAAALLLVGSLFVVIGARTR